MTAKSDLPGIVNGPVLLLGALLASPGAILVSEGLLSMTEMLTRYLIITVGCMVLWAVVRAWLAGMLANPATEVVGDAPGSRATESEAITGVVLDAPSVVEPTPVDINALDMTPEELIELSLRKSHEPAPRRDG
ncbi:hypothetical protein [Nocardioides stalactiti]|uniref:hypothetical protein n=1 Tax=Nocardioides stalactiti TaxID=2755356 RepID=UPI001601212E|nr:hypothetical protein [Nocardioides stalactiti]